MRCSCGSASRPPTPSPTTACERVPSARSALRRRPTSSWRKRGGGTSGGPRRSPGALHAARLSTPVEWRSSKTGAATLSNGREVSRDGETVREHKFDQVTALLNKADNAATPPDEAATARTAAGLMLKYAFEEEEIRQAQRRSGVETPEIRRFNVHDSGNPFGLDPPGTLPRTRQAHPAASPRATGDGNAYSYVVGFPTDLDFLDLLYTIVRLSFSSNIEPPFARPTTTAPVADAPRRHRGSRSRRTGTPSAGRPSAVAFYRYAEANGIAKEEGHRRSPKVYRESFAEGFRGRDGEPAWRIALRGGAGSSRRRRRDRATGCRSLSAPARRWWRSSRTSGSPTSVLLRRPRRSEPRS